MAIQLEIDGDFVDTGEESINMEIIGPYIQENFTKASGSYTFKLPATDSIKKKWRHMYDLNIDTPIDLKLPAKIYWGVVLFTAVAYLNKVSNDLFECVLQIQSGYFFDTLSEKKLNELDLEADRIQYITSLPGGFLYPVDITKKYPDVNFACPFVYNELFYGSDYFKIINYASAYSPPNFYFPKQYPGFISNNNKTRHLRLKQGIPLFQNRLILMPFLKYLIDKVFEESGYTYDSSFFSDEEIASLILYNPHAYEEETLLPPLPSFLYYYDYDLKLNVPKITGRELLTKIKNTFCLGIFPSTTSKTMKIKTMNEVLEDNSYVDWTLKLVVQPNHVTHTKWNDKKYGVNLSISKFDESWMDKNLFDYTGYVYQGEVSSFGSLPSSADEKDLYYLKSNVIPVHIVEWLGPDHSDYSPGLSNSFNGGLSQDAFTNITVWKYDNKYYYKSTNAISDFIPTPLPTSDADCTEVYLEGFYKYNIPNDEWNFFARNVENFTIGDVNKESVEITETASTIYPAIMSNPTDAVGAAWPGSFARTVKCPVAFHKGESFVAKYEGVFKDVCLLFYRGVAQDSLGDDYPFASADDTDMEGTEVGDYTLYWHGEKGLYKKWWEKYANFLLTTYHVEFYFLLDINDFLDLDLSKKIKVFDQRFFIDKLSFDLNNQVTDKILVKALMLKI